MIDHISVGVSDLERAARFYEATLAPLGLSRLVTRPATIGFGKSLSRILDQSARRHGAGPAGKRRPYLSAREDDGRCRCVSRRGAGAGGRSDGAPGLRPHDRVRYYAAFVIDPDGNRIEAVTFPDE